MDELPYLLALNKLFLTKGHITKCLLNAGLAPSEIFKTPIKKLCKIVLPEETRYLELIKKVDLEQFLSEIKRCEKLGVELIPITDKRYPALLKEIYDPPVILWVKGEFPAWEERPPISIIGSRKATQWGRESAYRISSELAGMGFTIISGLAYGIDSVAHHGAVASGGISIGVLGSGADVIYPAVNKGLASKMLELGGAIISEFPLGSKPDGWHFPLRNRIISGLSLGIIVAEARGTSGSLITVRYAIEQGRDVFAMPGPAGHLNAQGTHKLLRDGAIFVETAEDVAAALGFKPKKEELDQTERDILAHIGDKPVDIDAIIEASGADAKDVVANLTSLMMKGEVVELPGKRYKRGKFK